MSFLNKLFGSKSDRDIKTINPQVDQIREAYEIISKLSNDELRGKTTEFRERIYENVEAEELELVSLKDRIEQEFDMDVEEKERIYKKIDELEGEIYKKTQEILNEILPEAFAVVKDTARRFTENNMVEVTANQFDRDMAARKDNVDIQGDKALWHNQWMAGGNMITWDMVHYDVQLIGGIVLHDGKISEMGTGEGKTLVATLPVYLNALPGKEFIL